MYLTTEILQQIIQEELESVIAEDCQDGYERVPGSKEFAPGSCRKKTNEEQIDEAAICKKGKDWVDGKTIGGQKVSRGKDGKFNNWSARAAQIASKYCKDPNYGKGRGKDTKKEQMIREEEGGLKKWEKENWTHSDGSPCGAPKDGGDGSDSRCKPASEWAKMSSKEKEADNAKKKRGTDRGEQYVKSNHPVKNESRKRVIEVRIKKKSKMKEEAEITDDERKELEDVSDQLKGAVKAHGNQAKTIDNALKKEGKKNCGCGQDPCKTYGAINEEEEIDEKKSPAWQRKAGKNKKGGLNAKGRKSYEKENPGSDLKAPVSAKQAKKSKGGKAAKRRKSFCARMKGMKKKRTSKKTANDPDSRINKSLRKWDC